MDRINYGIYDSLYFLNIITCIVSLKLINSFAVFVLFFVVGSWSRKLKVVGILWHKLNQKVRANIHLIRGKLFSLKLKNNLYLFMCELSWFLCLIWSCNTYDWDYEKYLRNLSHGKLITTFYFIKSLLNHIWLVVWHMIFCIFFFNSSWI